MELVATGESVSLSSLDPLLGALLALPLALLLAALGVIVLRWLVLWRAPRFGAARDRAAATSLVIHAGTPAWLSTVVPLPWIGDLLGLAGAVMALVLLWHGAPRMLPPDPGLERAMGWSAVWMALLSVAILLVIGLVGVFTIGVAATALLTSFATPG